MKINDPNGTGISGVRKTQDISPFSQGSRVRGGSAGPGDQVQLSSLSSVLGALQTDSPQRAARLDQLSAVVGGGGYSVDSYAVSGSLIRESLAASFR